VGDTHAACAYLQRDAEALQLADGQPQFAPVPQRRRAKAQRLAAQEKRRLAQAVRPRKTQQHRQPHNRYPSHAP